MMRCLVLGAGKVGRTVAGLLAGTGDYQIVVADRDAAALRVLAGLDCATRVIDATRDDELAAAIRSCDAVINVCPYSAATSVAKTAAALGVAYFDPTEDFASARAIAELAAGAGNVMAPQCGLAPGAVSIIAADLAAGFDRLDSLRLRVGALPLYPTNALKYNLTWSTHGLINEYCNPCAVILDGEPGLAAPLEGVETFALDGVAYEAFNTSGGVGTLCDSFSGRVRQLDYKTIRYPGHRDIMKVLLDDLGLARRREVLCGILEDAVPTTHQDVVLIFVTATGWRDGAFVQDSYVKRIHGGPAAGARRSAIQIATAAGLCAVLDLWRQGQLAVRGLIRQEEIAWRDFAANRFGRIFRADPEQGEMSWISTAFAPGLPSASPLTGTQGPQPGGPAN